MAWWRSGAPRDGEPLEPPDNPDVGYSEWERSPWDTQDRGDLPPLGSDVLSSDRPVRRPRRPRRAEPPTAPQQPAGPSLPLPADEELDHEQLPEEHADEDAGGRKRPTIESARRWTRDRKAVLLPMAVFAAGALLGSVGIHGYDAQLAAEAQRDTVNLTARVAEDSTPRTGAQRPWILRVIVTNSGQTDILIRSASLADGRFQSHLRPVSQDTRIRGGQESWLSMDVTHSCVDGGPAPAPQTLELTVVPSGRPSRQVRVRLADDGARMVDAARQNCLNPDTDVWTSAELSGPTTLTRQALTVPIRIHLVGPEPLAVREIRTSSPGLSVIATPLPVRFSDGITGQTVLRWSVADCARAKVVTYAEIGITATVMLLEDAESLRTDAVLDANAVLAIVRFISSICE